MERSKNTVNYIAYELTSYPTSLFQDNFMQHPDKSDLMHVLLNYHSEIAGDTVIHCEDDADTKIVEAALDFAFEKNNVTVFADNTDIFILLL